MRYRLIKKFPGLGEDSEIGDIFEKQENGIYASRKNRYFSTCVENIENWPEFFEKVTEDSDFRFFFGDWETINNALNSTASVS